MGIHDRDYYRDDRRWSNPFARSQATLFLALLFCCVYIAQIATMEPGRPFDPKPGFTPFLVLDIPSLFEGEVWRVLSYALVHNTFNPMHLIATLIFLVWIGHQVEDVYGSKEYLAYFTASTLLGGAVYAAMGAVADQVPPLMGPAGAVTAVLVLFVMHYPTRSLTCYFYFPAWLLIPAFAMVDVAGLTSGTRNPAAVAVHLAGAAFAVVYHAYTLRVLNWLPARGEPTPVRYQSRQRLRVFQDPPPDDQPERAETAAATPVFATALLDEHLEAKLDEVLEKVTKHGKESLTDAEREILHKASAVFKKRRQSN